MDLKVLNNERALTIASSLVTVVSALAARNYVVTAVCTGNASNGVSKLNELHAFSLSRQATLSIIRIWCVAQTTNLPLVDFLMEARGPTLSDIQRILAALPDDTGAPFSNVPRLVEEQWFSLGEIINYIMIHWTEMIGLLNENREPEVLAALNCLGIARLNAVMAIFTQFIKYVEGNFGPYFDIFQRYRS
jgi:hypothetical protein